MFDKILIANRGEIACRIIRTARRLGIGTVAVYSSADAGALHVRQADQAWPIGPAPAAESYLNIPAIIDTARRAGASAIHPGYGFLSENPALAEACEAAGLVFIGPPAAAIRAMGSKTNAKRLMETAGVPVVPGYHEDQLDLKMLATAARKIGYPVLIKATAGGGGRGMRVVQRELDLAESIKSARREAESAFGDDRVLIEKYLTRPRHIEVQVFADRHGHVVHLFERDCSIQRRHQKVIEEAPAAAISQQLAEQLGATAVAATRAIGYVGAGTVEFIVDRLGGYYFMEMNTRLQVEHPVTEMITGLDLVEWQLLVAAGENLPLTQDRIGRRGHAIEARLYAEDPRRNYAPSVGLLVHLTLPSETPGVRVETGVGEGDQVSPYYDAMLAKIVVHAEDRAAAIRRLRRALGESEVVGVTTNLAFLGAILAHPEFAENVIDTNFIERALADLLPPVAAASDQVLALAVLHHLLERAAESRRRAGQLGDPTSPWAAANSWRLNDDSRETIALLDGERAVAVTIRGRRQGYALSLPGGELQVAGELGGRGALWADLGGVAVNARIVRQGAVATVLWQGGAHRLSFRDPLAVTAVQAVESGRLTAPMPGRITQVLVEPGALVKRGAALVVVEAMKMEHTIAAPGDGRVEKLRFALGEWVEEGATLLDFEMAG